MLQINLLYALPVIAIVLYLYHRLTRNNDYFLSKPIPSLAVKPIFGSVGPLMLRKVSFAEFIQSIYDKFPNAKIFGMFELTTPVFVLRDPDLIKQLTVKDFDHFVDHVPSFGSSDYDHPNLVVAKSLFTLTGQKWKNMRATLSPAFTGSKMRQMFELIVECSENTARNFEEEARAKGCAQEYEMKDVFGRFASDVIATCAFGIKVDAIKDPKTEFYVTGKKMMNFNRFSIMLRMIGYRMFPALMARLGIDLIDAEHNKYFTSLILSAIKDREDRGVVRPDMINLLIQAKKGQLKHHQEKEQNEGFATVQESDVGKAQISSTMTDMEMVAQCLIFFLAGFDTVSTCLLFLTYELTINPDVQRKLHQEIVETQASLGGKSLTYDAMQRMKYMDMVVSEALRMWPPSPSTDRLCIKDYTVDCGDGLTFTIDKGAGIWLPTHALHHDSKYFPDPEKFDPERFSDDRRGSINSGAYLPFGIGPRNCIGSRLALAEVKTIVYYLLLSFSLERSAKTEVPLVLVKGFGDVTPEKGVHLEFRPRK
ncbi:cytochrome P450 9e2-like [Toxorhynchites rutilus septentrionalis]|uniref:cytochrome P450 9e2-like n=1 Tax=Toxorhynchites rutilus septentrionalis TaxID=329112 RepID=UPI0024792753|nr:cytochrome P450 9e2-like [Toxorhynchites rutilus septentrionalis]